MKSNLDGPSNMINNIDYFNIVAGYVLSKLYRNFPLPVNVNVGHYTLEFLFTSDVMGEKYLCWEYDEDHNDIQLVASVIDWLIAEGYIRCPAKHGALIYPECVLSSKGIQILSSNNPSSGSPESFGDKIVSATKEGLADGVKEVAKNILCEGTKYIFQNAMDSFMRVAIHG